MAKRKSRLVLWPLLLAVDCLVNVAAFATAYIVRYQFEIGQPIAEEYYAPFNDVLPVLWVLAPAVLASYGVLGVYRKTPRAPWLDEVTAIIQATSVGVVIALAFAFLAQNFAYSRLVFVYFWVAQILYAILARLVVRLVIDLLRRRGIGITRVLVVGSGNLAKTVMHIVATEPGTGYHLVGFVRDEGEGDIGRFRCLGSLGEIERVIADHAIDEVLIVLPSRQHARAMEISRRCDGLQVSFKLVPDLYEISLNRVNVNELRGVPLIGIRERTIHGLNLAAKRLFDILVGALLLVLLAPVFLLVALAIRLDSPGPILFRQKRVGRGGQTFICLKFRSMYADAEQRLRDLLAANEADGPLFKMKEDPRRTRVGRWLRRLSLDELPQIFNVLRGEMSLVGPRPPLPAEVENYEDWQLQRLAVRPGMTGLWQVRGRSELPFEEMVLMDIYYIENWSLGLDFNILLRTIPAVLSGRGAY